MEIWFNEKLGLEWTMNGLEKPFRKKIRSKKNSKNQSEITAREPLPRKRIFVQTPFSHSTLKLERKISRRKTTKFLTWLLLLFCLTTFTSSKKSLTAAWNKQYTPLKIYQ